MARPATRDDRALRAAALLYLVGFVLHTLDHLRRGLDVVTHHVFWAGNLSAVLAAACIVLVLAHHRLAPFIATAVGFTVAIGVSAVHLLPYWSAFSDSLPDGNTDWFTWVAVLTEIVGSALTGVAGLTILRRSQWRVPAVAY
jgi:hypothetical protein